MNEDIPEENDHKGGIKRRTLLKTAVATALGSIAAGIGILVGLEAQSRLAPQPERQVLDTFLYQELQGPHLPVWYSDLLGEEARITHFQPGRGANVQWRTVLDETGSVVSGLPALLIMMDEEVLEFPTRYARYEFVIQGLYAVFNCCTHACCRPGWQLFPRSSQRDDLGYENIYCPCHDSQFNPRRIAEYTHPPPPDASGATYLGVSKEPGIGPGDRGMPLIPIGLEGDKIVGSLSYPEWYRYLDFKGRREF